MPPDPATMSRSRLSTGATLLVPYLTAFVASACVMALELIAGRVVSRHLGSSLYTWTSIIAAVLGGLAVGNYIGGRLADRYRTSPTLALLFILSSAGSLLVPIVNTLVGDWSALWFYSWPMRIAIHVTLTFAPPAALLGTIGPVVAKMALDRGRAVGRTVGSVYAWGTVGSILGTFVTGYYLSSILGVHKTIHFISAILALLGVLFAARHWLGYAWILTVLTAAAASFGPSATARAWSAGLGLREPQLEGVYFDRESRYSHVRVQDAGDEPGKRVMLLDKLVHSFYNPLKPDELLYGYENVYSAVTDHVIGPRDGVQALILGGGGFTHPRSVLRKRPQSRLQVVEIDPVVTEAALAAFGLTPDPRMEIIHLDARQYVSTLLRRKLAGEPVAAFDLVFIDAINDYTVPPHLTTLEFHRMIKELMTDDGVLMMTLIDILDIGRFLAASLETTRRTFKHVECFFADEAGPGQTLDTTERNTFVLVASDRDLALDRMGGMPAQDAVGRQRVPADIIDALTRRVPPLVLTDEFSPVENLLSEVVQRSGQREAADRLYYRAKVLEAAGDKAGMERAYRQALELHPKYFLAYIDLGVLMAGQQRWIEAETCFRAAATLRPAATAPLLNLGTVYFLKGDNAAAEGEFRRVLELSPEHVEAHFSLAKALGRQGKLAESRDEFKEVLRLDPNYPRAWQHLDEVEKALGAQSQPAG